MENLSILQPMNAYGGKWQLAAGLALALAAIGFFFIPDISLDVYSYSTLAVGVVMFPVAMVASFRYRNPLLGLGLIAPRIYLRIGAARKWEKTTIWYQIFK